MWRALPVATAILLVARPALAEDDPKRFSLTISLPLLLGPVVELMGEYRISDRIGLAGVAGGGQVKLPIEDDPATPEDEKGREPFAYWEAGGQIRFYPIGGFEHGMQLGLELLYVGLHGENVAGTSWDGTAHGVQVGPFVGYKLVTGAGFTLDLQLGPAFLGVVIDAENDGGTGEPVEESDTDSSLQAIVNLDLGWSF